MNKTLLVVDDIEMNRQFFLNTFGEEYSVFSAKNGLEALKILHSKNIGIVITDMYMDEMDGFTLISEIRKRREWDNIKIIAITEKNIDIQQKVLNLGADIFVSKPYNSKLMKYHINNFMDEEETERRINQYYTVFDKNPISFMLFHLNMDESGNYNTYRISYYNPATEKLYEIKNENKMKDYFGTKEFGLLEFFLRVVQSKKECHRINYLENLNKYIDITAYQDQENYIACVSVDVTEQVLKEKKRANQMVLVEKKERENLKRIINNLQVGVIVFEKKESVWSVAAMNPKICKMIGITEKEMQKKGMNYLYSILKSEDKEKLIQQMRKFVETMENIEFSYWIENAVTKKKAYLLIKATANRELEDKEVFYVTCTEITKQRKLEENLKENRQEMRLIMKNSEIDYWKFDMYSKKIQFLNNLDENEEEEQLFSKPKDIIFYSEQDKEIWENMHNKLLQNTNETAQLRMWSDKRKEFRWYEVTYIVCEGEEKRVIGSRKDITREKRAEQLLLEEEKMQQGSDSGLIGYTRINLSKSIVESHQVGDEIVSQIPNDLIDYRKRLEYYYEDIHLSDFDNQQIGRDNLLKLYEHGIQKITKEFIAKRKCDGVYFCIQIMCKMLEYPGTGEIIAFYYTRDWTKKYVNKNAMEAMLRYDYDYIGMIFEKTKRVHLLDERKNSMIRKPSYDNYNIWIAEYLKECAVGENIEKIIQENQIEVIEKKLEQKDTYTVNVDLREDGKNVRAKQLRYAYANKDYGTIVVTRIDIQDLVKKEKEKQKELEDALQLAEKASHAKSEFLATVSHEIRTPMNVVLGLAQLATDEVDHKEIVLDYIDKIKVSGNHLLHLVNDVLDMSKIESGKFTLHPEKYYFNDFLKNMQSVVVPLCEEKNIHFEVVGKSESLCMFVDKLRINQIFINILSNSVKFTDVGGKLQFIYQNTLSEDKIILEADIKDNGIGMSKEFQKKLFRPFNQEENKIVSYSQGTGLGLSIAHGIVEKMGGSITVQSEKNVGTNFHVRLEIQMIQDDENQTIDDISEKINLEKKKILVVEDHPVNRMILGKMLEKKGAEILYAENGKEGVEVFNRSLPGEIDFIFMDIRMPVMNGLDATKKIRKLERKDAKMIPIFAMTANAYDEDREKAEIAGITEHLAKPIDLEGIYHVLWHYLI